MSNPRKFQLKAQHSWRIQTYKGKLRIIMNRDNFKFKQKITPYDVLSPSKVRSLVAWLNRYLNIVSPTEQSVVIAGIRAQNNGMNRNIEKLEALQNFGLVEKEKSE